MKAKPRNTSVKKRSKEVEAKPSLWPQGVPRHARILSAWDDKILRLDGTPATGVREIDLSTIPLPANDDIEGPFPEGLTLAQFPHWMEVARAYAALAFQDVGGHDPAGTVINGLNHLFRFFAWCVRRRVYHLTALRQEDMEALARDLRPEGWFSALSVRDRLQDVLSRARDDHNFCQSLVNIKTGEFSISPDRLSQAIGVVITSREYPPFLRLGMAEHVSFKLRGKPFERNKEWSQASFKLCFGALNRLARLPDSVDRLKFEPFPNAREYARQSGGKPDGRTINLPLEEAVKILGSSLAWVYDRSDGVLELVKIWRDALQCARRRWIDEATINSHVIQQLQAAYPEIRDRYGLPDAQIYAAQNKGDSGISVIDLVQRLQTGVALLVGINQARRKNEVLGEGTRPFGLYRGCLTLSDPFVDAYELDIYIEKTWRAWMKMSTNRLVVDAVRVLERLRAIMLPEELEDSALPQEVMRSRKLFIIPSHALLMGRKADPDQYSFEIHSDAFFEEAAIEDRYRRTHPMRRIFALIYMYRWDHPSLQALSEYLCHVDLECTRIYVTDDAMRQEAERIEKVYRGRIDCMPVEELTEAQLIYRDDQLRAMLSRTTTGGPLTYRVRKWVRRLAHKAEFIESELDDMVAAARTAIEMKGYLPLTFPHGVCWAHSAGTAARVAKCGDGAALHRERASIRVCGSCPFHSTSAAFLKNIENDAQQLERSAADARDPREADQYRAAATELRELIELECALMSQRMPLVGMKVGSP